MASRIGANLMQASGRMGGSMITMKQGRRLAEVFTQCVLLALGP